MVTIDRPVPSRSRPESPGGRSRERRASRESFGDLPGRSIAAPPTIENRSRIITGEPK
ncbi:hypothetical protein V0288_07585 [Pannus brasiliensis CCIBt3594]|uniref:Uncharacterized protein n=1 Tax=Pannus brasiliensis CCIBt3594 TaxID=1427578 RepID=A0AAW9QW96_9CHRO